MAGEFFQRYLPDPALARGIGELNEAVDVFRAARRPDIAVRLEAELRALVANLERQTIDDALRGTRIIRDTLRQRLVRPETAGPHLASRVHSEVLAGIALGAIGYGNIHQLDQAIDPDYAEGGTYWRAIEYGSDAAVGRVVVGYFQPGFSIPAGSEFRKHPMFMSQGASGFLAGMVGAPAMRVTRPIEPKHFLRDGSRNAAAMHEGQMQRIQGRAISTMLAATASSRTR